MNTQEIIISNHKIEKLRKYAESNFLDSNNIRNIMNGKEPCAGERPNHECILTPENSNGCYVRIVYSIEQHSNIWVRHISIGVFDPKNNEHSIPNQSLVSEIAKLFGFPVKNSRLRDDVHQWIEDDIAINAVCKIEKKN